MPPQRKSITLIMLLLTLTLLLAACEDESGIASVENLPAPQSSDEIEETIEESGLEGQTALEGQEEQTGDTTEEQMASNQAAYALGAQAQLVPLSWLLDRNVETLNEVDLGEIDDLLVDRSSGRILFALIEHGGLLDIGETELPVPLNLLQYREQSELMLPVDEQTWEAWPELGDDWSTNLSIEQANQINAFWNEIGQETPTLESLDSSQVVRASTWSNTGLSAPDAPALGQVQNLLVDLANRQIKYLVVTATDPAAYGEGALLLPYGAIDIAASGEQPALLPEFDLGLLQNAPRIPAADLEGTEPLAGEWDDTAESYWVEAGYTFEGG